MDEFKIAIFVNNRFNKRVVYCLANIIYSYNRLFIVIEMREIAL